MFKSILTSLIVLLLSNSAYTMQLHGGRPRSVAGSAPTIVGTVSSLGTYSSSSTRTITNHNVPSGTNILIVTFIGEDQAAPSDTPASCTWNTSENLTHHTSADSVTNQNEVAVWYIVNPTAVTANVVCTSDSDHDGSFFSDAVVAINVSGGNSISAQGVGSNTNSTAISGSITTTADNALVLSFFGLGEGNTLGSYGAGQTEEAEETTATFGGSVTSEVVAVAGTDIQSATASASTNRLVMSTIAINPM